VPPYRFGLTPPFEMPTEAHQSVTPGRGTQRVPRPSRTGEPSIDHCRRAGPGPSPPPPSLSFPFKKGNLAEASFFVAFLPNAEVRHPATRHRLAAVWLRHWAIPHAWLIYTSMRFFGPRFQHHRCTLLPATVDHAGGLHLSTMRARSTASRRWQPSLPCS
jgi:hypothetical protein